MDEVLVEKVVARLQAESYLSDERFVESYIYSRIRKFYGPKRISYELRKRGVSDTLIDKGLSAVQDWLVHAKNAYRKKYGDSSSHKELSELLKRKRYLYERGFDEDIIGQVLKFPRN